MDRMPQRRGHRMFALIVDHAQRQREDYAD